jgi:hypothetical protein
MDFKNYVRMMLEAEKAKDQDEDAEDQNEDEDDDSDEDDDDEAQASVKTNKTGCTGGEASCDTDDDDSEEDDEEDDEDDDDSDKDDDKEEKGPSLKESMIYSSRYLSGNTGSVMTEETRILIEGIKDNSASKYLAKLSKRAEKEAAKFTKKGMSKEASTSKKAAASLKEASNKLYRCETRYKSGDVSAKKEYKQICKQYSKELKSLGKGARGLKGLVLTLIAGTLLLGAIGTTVAANAGPDGGIVDKIDTAVKSFKEGNSKGGLDTLKDIAGNDAKFVNSMITGEKFTGSDWGEKKANMDAIKNGWASAEERRKYTEEGLGGAIKKTKQAAKDFGDGFANYYKGANEVIGKTVKGAKEAAKN